MRLMIKRVVYIPGGDKFADKTSIVIICQPQKDAQIYTNKHTHARSSTAESLRVDIELQNKILKITADRYK